MFYDEAQITVIAGRGGDGVVSFRREAMVPRGGPDGGNGGRGGDVILVVNRHLNTLGRFRHQRRFVAPDGKPGRGKNQTGRSGRPLYIDVPPGTVVRDAATDAVIADLVRHGQQAIVARGGRGGRGNAAFATPNNQAPQMAENGAPGETRELLLTLKLIADIGLVGMPNAGKSTLLAALTAAKPKIADYPFTTLQPNLGVAEIDAVRTVVLADIPGLIEGASQGAGLGIEFLKHIERTRVLIHLIDGLSEDPLRDYHTIQKEMAAFGHGLIDKPQVLAMTKMDLPDAQAAYELYCKGDPTSPLHDALPISAASGKNTRALLERAVRILDELPSLPEEEPVALEELTAAEQEHGFEITREGGGFRIHSPVVLRRVETTRWDLDEAVQRFQRFLERSGISAALEAQGVKPGDIIYIGDYELEWGE
ncbi:MAG: GTPase ObgE [Anaerolineae bacterium]|nr:GTPase ObgE [Thermoflexales bacterium]MDW8406956.1 GTPase ObgE [Anaerolineae bacterium]